MQLVELLGKLSTAELADLDKEVDGTARPTLIRLYKELKKLRTGKREFNRSRVYQAVFNESHDAEVDYKLRNETRILKNHIFQFIAQQEVLRELKQSEEFNNLWLMKALARHDLREPFTQQVDKLIDSYKDALNVDAALHLMQTKKAYYSSMGYANPLNPDEFMQLLEDIQEYQIRSMTRLLRDIDGSRALMVKTKSRRERGVLYKEQPLQLNIRDKVILSEHEDELTAAARLKADMYLQMGKRRIDTTYKFLKVIRSLVARQLVSVQVEAQLLETLATFLVAEKRYEEGWQLLNEHIELAEKHKMPPSVSIYHNKLYCLVLWGKYQEALDFFHENETPISSNRYFYFAVHDICYAHLFLHNGKEAIKLIHKYFLDATEEQMFEIELKTRFGFVIAHLADNDMDNASRELVNFRRSKPYVTDDSGLYKKLASLFSSYMKIKHDKGSAKYQALVEKATKLDNRLRSPVIQLHWLIKQL